MVRMKKKNCFSTNEKKNIIHTQFMIYPSYFVLLFRILIRFLHFNSFGLDIRRLADNKYSHKCTAYMKNDTKERMVDNSYLFEFKKKKKKKNEMRTFAAGINSNSLKLSLKMCS